MLRLHIDHDTFSQDRKKRTSKGFLFFSIFLTFKSEKGIAKIVEVTRRKMGEMNKVFIYANHKRKHFILPIINMDQLIILIFV